MTTRLVAALVHQQPRDAAGGVAAGAGLAAVGIADAHEGVGEPSAALRCTISWSQPMPRRGRRWRAAWAAVERERALARVDHDEVVAEAMHLEKNHRLHAALYGLAAPEAQTDFRHRIASERPVAA